MKAIICMCVYIYIYIYIYIYTYTYTHSITLRHVSVFATRPNIINFPSVSCLSWIAPESCRILVLVWDLAYLTFVFVLEFAAGGWMGVPQSSVEDKVIKSSWSHMIWVRHSPPAMWMWARGWPTNRTQAAGKDLDPFLLLLLGRMESAKNKKNELEGGKK